MNDRTGVAWDGGWLDGTGVGGGEGGGWGPGVGWKGNTKRSMGDSLAQPPHRVMSLVLAL